MIDLAPLQETLPGNALLKRTQVADLVDWILDELSKYSEDQPRDDHGRWGSGGSSSVQPSADDDSSGGEKSSHPGGVKGHLHELLESGKPFTLQELTHATGSNEKRIKFLISRLQNPKYAAAGKHPLIISQNAEGKYVVTGTKDKLTAEEKQAIKEAKKASTVKPEIATKAESIGGHSFTGDPNNPGSFVKNNIAANNLIKEVASQRSPQEQKSVVAKAIAERLTEHKEWNELAKAVEDKHGAQGMYGSNASERLANRIIGNWASTSGDSDNMARAMQLAAREEFGIKDATLGHMQVDEHGNTTHGNIWDRLTSHLIGSSALEPPNYGSMKPSSAKKEFVDKVKSAFRAFTRAEYDHTQEFFASKGIKEISVFRGMKQGDGGQEAKLTTLHGQPLSSFSTSLKTAKNFGQRVYMATIPVAHVVGSTLTGRGCLNESEFVVIGHPVKAISVGRNHLLNFDDIDRLGHQATHGKKP